MKLVIRRLNANGEILCEVQQELQDMRVELGSLRTMVTDLAHLVRTHLIPTAPGNIHVVSPRTQKAQSPIAGPQIEVGPSGQEKNSEVKRAQLRVVPGWVTFLGSLPTGTVVGPVCWLGRQKWYQSLAQPEVQELSATQGKVLRYGSHLLKPYFLGS
ncbi:hypothetical protein Taro_001288, partial [Colocasia esculenta]|nr:hypothetical protein [Colocasia esculenta]